MNNTPLQTALDWWSRQDGMGGYKTAAAALFPGWEARRSGRAPHREDRTPSFSIYKNSAGAWRFKDHASGEQGGLVGFVMLAGMDEKAAARWVMERWKNDECLMTNDESMTKPEARMGTAGDAHHSSFDHSDLIRHSVIRHSSLPRIPSEVVSTWHEGLDHMDAHPECAVQLAAQRGWPVDFARYLVECGTVSMPLYHGARTHAFLVSAPTPAQAVSSSISAMPATSTATSKALPNTSLPSLSDPSHRHSSMGGIRGIVMRDIGFHCRLQAPSGENGAPLENHTPLQTRATWRFVPNDAEHAQSTPALPFIIGGPWFPTARLIVITEGQWDALTFALAAGWLGEGCRWPEGVCVLGIRGASGTRAFLNTYAQFWPTGADCLLLPDGDGAGGRWFQGDDSFADQLAGLCRKVAVERCAPHKDFNDLYRARKIIPAQIAQLLASHGMAMESGVAA